MDDVMSLIDRFRGEYTAISQELDHALVAGHSVVSNVLNHGEFCIGERTRRVWNDLGISEEDIVAHESELREVCADLPSRPGCLSSNAILDFIEQAMQYSEARKSYNHLLGCGYCRSKLFKSAWFFLV